MEHYYADLEWNTDSFKVLTLSFSMNNVGLYGPSGGERVKVIQRSLKQLSIGEWVSLKVVSLCS